MSDRRDNPWPELRVSYRLDSLTWERAPRTHHASSPSQGDPLRAQIERLMTQIPIDFGGGCSASKAYVMACLIRELKITTSLDIGVYRGRSLLPQALAHRLHTGGVAFGVDPYSKDAARENDNRGLKAGIDRFVETTDFDALFSAVDGLRVASGLADHCTLVRKTSAAAAEDFRREHRSFGLIHIDGNHDAAPVMQDVSDYLPLLAPGGILVMDDVSWDSVKPACARVAERLPRLFQRRDALNDYAVYWNVPSMQAAAWLDLFNDEFVKRG